MKRANVLRDGMPIAKALYVAAVHRVVGIQHGDNHRIRSMLSNELPGGPVRVKRSILMERVPKPECCAKFQPGDLDKCGRHGSTLRFRRLPHGTSRTVRLEHGIAVAAGAS